jgi:hypothetical protein
VKTHKKACKSFSLRAFLSCLRFISDDTPDNLRLLSTMLTAKGYECLKDKYVFEQRGAIPVKGKGEMLTYWLTGRKLGKP